MSDNPNPGLLTHDEVIALTGKRKFKAQARALKRMGVRFVLRPNGSAVVPREALARLIGARVERPSAPARPDLVVDLSPKSPRRTA